MTKRLVVCCDGTWSRPDQITGRTPTPTNVTKVALATAPRDAYGCVHRAFYRRGVGTNKGERIRGGAFGFGLSRDVRGAYRFLVRNFEPDDEIFFFGFSRGAFTARSTAGLVRNSGILRREHEDRVDEAYALYRSRRKATHPRGVEATLFRRSYSHETRIRFIGVWDTVGALGIPLDGLRAVNVVNRRWQFHDTDLSTSVDAAFQALAIDERRGPFQPAVWVQQQDASDQRLEQVWFAGVHSDVGGGYPETGLSDIALLWMVDRARSCGLAFADQAFTSGQYDRSESEAPRTLAPDPLGPLHESRTGFYRLLRPVARPIAAARTTHVASTAVDRFEQSGYAPPGLVRYLQSRAVQVMPVTWGR